MEGFSISLISLAKHVKHFALSQSKCWLQAKYFTNLNKLPKDKQPTLICTAANNEEKKVLHLSPEYRHQSDKQFA
jgi:hypothetical protein